MSLFGFDNSYARLPARFFARLPPTPVNAPRLIRHNAALALQLGLDPDLLASAEGVAVLAGNQVPADAAPLAQAYAGHQFGNFVPQLGDGRAILLGEVVDTLGTRRDIQLKGAGPTPFSRGGDGRAVLGPVLREYLMSEAMHALGVPTTRALAAVVTKDRVIRDRAMPGAVFARVATSHVRVGTFQFFAARGDEPALRTLTDYVIARHYPEAAEADNSALALVRAVMTRQADLIAHWLRIGFIHGVMNTDNTSIVGETIDYGPCAFMDRFDPATVFSSIDHLGRYAYGAQPKIIGWNMARFAETLLPLIDPDPTAAVDAAQEVLEQFSSTMDAAWLNAMRAKLGLLDPRDDDRNLVLALLSIMQSGKADLTNTFRALCDAAARPDADAAVRDEFAVPERYDEWAITWRKRIADESQNGETRRARMREANPAFIPRNHRVEAALAAALDDDYGPFDELLTVMARPYDDQPEHAVYRATAPQSAEPYRTFCGT